MAITLIKTAPLYAEEKKYIINVILKEFLGVDFDLAFHEENETWMIFPNSQRLVVADILFQTPIKNWLTPESLPKQPLPRWDGSTTVGEIPLVDKNVPIIYGESLPGGYWVDHEAGLTRLGIDIFGGAFFMLTRLEELIKPDRDAHGRFPATASLAFQEQFLERPIINEYVEIIWVLMKQLCPTLSRRARSFRFLLSHDVDRPYEHAFRSLGEVSRNIAGDIALRSNPKSALNRFKTWKRVRSGDDAADPFFTFDWIMDLSEAHGLQSSFNFIPKSYGKKKFESSYDLSHPRISKLMQTIHSRGHEIGYHASYTSFDDPLRIQEEVKLLQTTCDQLKISQNQWGGRQHYLRWKPATTWQNWEDAHLSYDSTLTFAEHAGFRTGSCNEYSAFNLKTKEHLKLKERPLIVMDGSIVDEAYMGLRLTEKAFEKIKLYFRRCRLFNGDFTLLWHNSSLASDKAKSFYKDVIHLGALH